MGSGNQAQAPAGDQPTTLNQTQSHDKPDSRPQDDYRFPHHKLKRTPVQEGKTPLVLVACGSFSVC